MAITVRVGVVVAGVLHSLESNGTNNTIVEVRSERQFAATFPLSEVQALSYKYPAGVATGLDVGLMAYQEAR
jgi:hypothetical protein